MTYTRHLPSPPLNTYIDDLYYIDGPAPYTHIKVLPMPSLGLIINFGKPFRVTQPDEGLSFNASAGSWWTGVWSTYHMVEWPQEVRFYGIHFKPGGVYPFLQIPLSELHNRVVPLEAAWGCFAAELEEQLHNAPDVEAGFAVLEQALLSRLEEAPYGLNTVQQAIGQIAQQHGTLSIRELSDEVGLSPNYLVTQFKRMVGLKPKELARFYRFAHTLRSINPMQAVDWMRVAHQYGYYDQSHFNKEFTAFTGHTPSDYLLLRRRLQAENPEEKGNIGQLPTE